MRALFVTIVLVPSLAYAQAAPGMDVHVDIHVDLPSGPPPPEALAPPSSVAPLADRTAPRRWVTLGGSFGIERIDGAPSDASDPAWSVRGEVDIARQGPWVLGAAAAVGGDQRFVDGLGPPTMYGYPTNYDGADLTDTRIAMYLAHVTRRGRFELRVQGGLGIVATRATRWSADSYDDVTTLTFTPIAEGGASVSVDIYGPVAFAIGPVVTCFNQKFAPMTDDPADRIQRGIDVQLLSALRYQL